MKTDPPAVPGPADAPGRATRPGRRRRSRELVLQGLYQRQLSGNTVEAVRAQLVEAAGFARADPDYFDALWRGASGEFDALVALSAPFLDRAAERLSPIERAILAIGAWELARRPDVPARVAIDEAVELAKAYGGTDGHRFVNGVLDKLAASLRPGEADPMRPGACAA